MKRQHLIAVLTLVMSLTGCLDPFAEPTTPDKQKLAASSSKSTQTTRNNREQTDREKRKQTYRQAWELMCHAENHSGVDPTASRAQRGAAVADWIVENITNSKARYWFINFGKIKPEQKQALFEAEVKNTGIDDCPLGDLLFGGDEDEQTGPDP